MVRGPGLGKQQVKGTGGAGSLLTGESVDEGAEGLGLELGTCGGRGRRATWGGSAPQSLWLRGWEAAGTT